MFTINKAVPEDFDRVYPLLHGFGGPPVPRDTWKKIFVSPWHTTEDFCGYLLLKNDKVEGYLGLLFSQRTLNGQIKKFCNMTSWVVNENSRGQSISMLLEVLKLKDYTLTNFTASPTVARILDKLGFTAFSVDQRVLFPIPNFARLQHGRGCDSDLQVIQSKLSGTDLGIFGDHQGLNCEHLLLRSDHGDCYVVLKKTVRRKLVFARVHYLSDVAVFHDCMESLTASICFRLGVFGVMVDERYIAGRKFRNSVSYPHQRKAYFKSNSVVESRLIDTLYSEVVVLHD